MCDEHNKMRDIKRMLFDCALDIFNHHYFQDVFNDASFVVIDKKKNAMTAKIEFSNGYTVVETTNVYQEDTEQFDMAILILKACLDVYETDCYSLSQDDVTSENNYSEICDRYECYDCPYLVECRGDSEFYDEYEV